MRFYGDTTYIVNIEVKLPNSSPSCPPKFAPLSTLSKIKVMRKQELKLT